MVVITFALTITMEEIMNNLLRIKSFLFLALVMFSWTALAAAQPPDFVSLAEQLKPAVVNIGTAKTVKPRVPGYRGRHGARVPLPRLRLHHLARRLYPDQ